MLQKHFYTVCLDRAAELRIRAMIEPYEAWRIDTLKLARMWVAKSREYRLNARAKGA
jgi:hypothetical protein